VSKASNWVEWRRNAERDLLSARRAQPIVSAWTPECLDWSAQVDSGGNLSMQFKRTLGGAPQWNDAGANICMGHEHALVLARWIIDTFDKENTTT
jgi:hypothetical protein